MTNRCVILGAAPVADVAALQGYLRPNDVFVAADGGWRLAQALGVRPRALIADFDSLPPASLPEEVERVRLPVKKDVTDTAAAVHWALEAGYRTFLFLGCTGGRLDHQHAALLTAVKLVREGYSAVLADERNRILPTVKSVTLPPEKQWKLSLFAFDAPVTNLTITGAAYPLEGYTLHSHDPLCVSNEFTREPCSITFDEGTLLLFLSKD